MHIYRASANELLPTSPLFSLLAFRAAFYKAPETQPKTNDVIRPASMSEHPQKTDHILHYLSFSEVLTGKTPALKEFKHGT